MYIHIYMYVCICIFINEKDIITKMTHWVCYSINICIDTIPLP